jgi:aspartate beta-hydroxylase
VNGRPGLRALKKTLVWTVVRGLGRARGYTGADLKRVEHHLRVDMGLDAAAYTEPLQKPRHYFSGLRAKPWHDAADFSWTRDLEAAHPTIKRELDRGRRAPLVPQPQGLADPGHWNIVYFYYRGQRVAATCERYPETARVIESIPALTSTGLVYFSVLAPASHIRPHCGPINTRLRCHLGVDVPHGCRIRVGSETRAWKEGKCLVFDDSFEHEVWHSGDTPRTVLILDVWHPDLTEAEVWAMGQIIRMSTEARTFGRSVRRNLEHAYE